MRQVSAADWVAEIAAAHAAGFDCLDMIAGVDRGESIEVIASVMRSADATCELVSTRLNSDRAIATVSHVYAGAAWYERELAEMFGVRVTGAADERPLLRRTDEGAPTMLKSTILGARVLTPWPGDADAGDDAKANRRRQRAVGVADDWLVDEGGADE
jgi:NADH:ubiquinone oxidoreductase subunit C